MELNSKHFTQCVKSVTNFFKKYRHLMYVTREMLVSEIRQDVETRENLGPFLFNFFIFFIFILFLLFLFFF
jgi:hypothetical protein